MKYLFVLALTLVVGCGAPSSVVTPAGQHAYKADQVVNYLGVFQDAAIGANNQNILSTNDTRLIVTFVKSAVTTIGQTPNGWQATVMTALNQLRNTLPKEVVDKYKVYLDLLSTMIASV